jgi:enoyl-CoA hydratase/carnithine racemase
MGTYTYIEKHAGWAEIVLNRPERRNALIPPMAGEITQAIEGLQVDKEIASILIRGEGGYLCSGIDLKALQADPAPEWQGKDVGDLRSMHMALYRCRKPLLCALERFAINAGAALVFACDLTIAGHNSFLQIGEIQQGSDIPMNAGWLKLKYTEQVLLRLSLLGDRVLGPELVTLGLALQSVDEAQVLETLRAVATRLASFPEGASETIIERIRGMRPEDAERVFPVSDNKALLTASQVRS